jgi:multidrug efflux pump subunit AcrA (membrane-fusion protein)
MRTFPVEVILDGKVSSELKSGMFASCQIQTHSNKDVVIAPEDAVIINNDGSTFSFVFDNGKALKKIVKTGIKSNGKIEIVSGLDKDALVITLGKERLTDGMIVKEK